MHIRAPQRLDRVEHQLSRPAARRRVPGWMLGGSVLLHLLLLALFFVVVPSSPHPAVQAPEADELQVVIQPSGEPDTASTASDTPDVPAAVAAGTPAPSAPAPTPDQVTVATPEPAPAPEPVPQPTVEASIQPPTPETQPQAPPPDPAPPPPPIPAPREPPAVSLQLPPDDQAPLLNLPPPFVPPAPPLVLPRPPAPPRIARVAPPRTGGGFPAPQNWSFNAAPSQASPNGARHGFDFSIANQAGRKDSSMQYVAGAHPGADWEAKVHAWIAARSYYPETAARQGHQGVATVFLRIDRTGRVLTDRLISSSGEPFLDGAWVDAWRGGVVPPFPPGVTDNVAEFKYTVFYQLVQR